MYSHSPHPRERAERTCTGPICRGRRRFLSEGPGHRHCPACRKRVVELCRTYSPKALGRADDPPADVFDD